MTTTETFEGSALSPETKEQLNTIFALYRLRVRLVQHGWRQDALWEDQDTPYSGQGSTCLTGGVAVVTGLSDLTDDSVDQLIANPVIVELDRTLATYPNAGREDMRFGAELDSDHYWRHVFLPAERLAQWNDYTGRTKREVLALIDATIERLESA